MSRIELTYAESYKQENGLLYKLCNRCNKWFPCDEEHFYKNNKSLLDGVSPTCKLCCREKANQRVAENREEHTKYCKEWYAQNRENHQINVRKYHDKNRTKVREYFKAYIKTEDGKKIANKHSRFRYTNKKHTITKKEWIACKEYFKNENNEWCCAYCGMTEVEHKLKYNQQLHKEHFDDMGSNNIDNCIPSCRICNSKKHTSKFNDWYNENNPIFSQERLEKIINWIAKDCKKIIETLEHKLKV